MTQEKRDLVDAISMLHCAAIQCCVDSASIGDSIRNSIRYLQARAKLSDTQAEMIRIASGQAWIIGRRQRMGY